MTVIVQVDFEAYEGASGHRRIAAALGRKGGCWPERTQCVVLGLWLKAAGPRRRARTTVPADGLDDVPASCATTSQPRHKE